MAKTSRRCHYRATSPRSGGGGPGGHPGDYGCTLCPRAFTTKRGLSVHIHYAHKKVGKVKPSDSDQGTQPDKTTKKRGGAEKERRQDLQGELEDQPVETEESQPSRTYTGGDQHGDVTWWREEKSGLGSQGGCDVTSLLQAS